MTCIVSRLVTNTTVGEGIPYAGVGEEKRDLEAHVNEMQIPRYAQVVVPAARSVRGKDVVRDAERPSGQRPLLVHNRRQD